MSIEVKDASDLRKYRTEIPNRIFDMGLSPFALALYGHFKRVCGASGGQCYQSTRTLAQATVMSVGKVSDAKNELLDAGLINVEKTGNNNKSHIVTIVDIWQENFEHYATRSSGEHPVHNMNATCSQYEPKKEPSKNELSKKSPTAALSAAEWVTTTVDRCREVDFEPTKRQKGTWAKEYDSRLGRGEEPRHLYALLSKVVEQASKGYFHSLKKAEEGPPSKNGKKPATEQTIAEIREQAEQRRREQLAELHG